MKSITLVVALGLAALAPLSSAQERKAMDMALSLGNFSVSLAVKDIRTSLAFYEKLGFQRIGGQLDQNWIVLQNGSARIGLFQGMFPKNLMTFNPGWGPDGKPLERFQDVRELQRTLKARGLTLDVQADEGTQGPAHFVITDPDGNPLLFDQHVPSPKKP